jgi:hypothetical protein
MSPRVGHTVIGSGARGNSDGKSHDTTLHKLIAGYEDEFFALLDMARHHHRPYRWRKGWPDYIKQFSISSDSDRGALMRLLQPGSGLDYIEMVSHDAQVLPT